MTHNSVDAFLQQKRNRRSLDGHVEFLNLNLVHFWQTWVGENNTHSIILSQISWHSRTPLSPRSFISSWWTSAVLITRSYAQSCVAKENPSYYFILSTYQIIALLFAPKLLKSLRLTDIAIELQPSKVVHYPGLQQNVNQRMRSIFQSIKIT